MIGHNGHGLKCAEAKVSEIHTSDDIIGLYEDLDLSLLIESSMGEYHQQTYFPESLTTYACHCCDSS